MKFITSVAVCAFQLLGAQAAVGSQSPPASERKSLVMYGVGQSSCGTWLEARSAERADNMADTRSLQLKSYLDGYLTAYNAYRSPTGDGLKGLDRPGQLGFLDKFCSENPTALFLNGITALIRQVENQ